MQCESARTPVGFEMKAATKNSDDFKHLRWFRDKARINVGFGRRRHLPRRLHLELWFEDVCASAFDLLSGFGSLNTVVQGELMTLYLIPDNSETKIVDLPESRQVLSGSCYLKPKKIAGLEPRR